LQRNLCRLCGSSAAGAGIGERQLSGKPIGKSRLPVSRTLADEPLIYHESTNSLMAAFFAMTHGYA
jgi:hypothetical protein